MYPVGFCLILEKAVIVMSLTDPTASGGLMKQDQQWLWSRSYIQTSNKLCVTSKGLFLLNPNSISSSFYWLEFSHSASDPHDLKRRF